MKDIVADYGAVPDFNRTTWSGTDNTAAFARAMAGGGRITVAGNFYVPGGVVMSSPTILQGDTFGTSGLFGAPGPSSDVVTMRPGTASAFYDGWGITDLTINAHAAGRHAIRVDLTNPGVYFPVPFWERLFLNGGLGNAFRLDNPNAASFFAAKFDKLLITSGGMYLENVGDSMVIRDTVINSSAQVAGGPAYGIAASFVSGAVLAIIEDCNIVVNGGPCPIGGISFPSVGAILLLNAGRPKISRLNSEASGPASMITLCGTASATVSGCSLNNHGLAAPVLIEASATDTILDNNDIEATGFPHVLIGPNCPKVAILGTNKFYASSGVMSAPVISNQSPPLWNPLVALS
jgi:hypothetical protein